MMMIIKRDHPDKSYIKRTSPAGLEPALPKGNGLAGHRVNHSAKVTPKKNNDNSPNIEDFGRFALILCSLGSSAQELQHI
ncbi:hypothetical protein BCR32DRAFT_286387 [Anaeromyces robustus]|uniref:Uncharacterized protein n=1 Tax=Anaeromyces robustus TaxID=1754192 RepID=A0A1Y1VXI8_9FUNG|nr:hypothetical protein BCR32DRAFT_286387 [Anaeromyces robustus]|eukprot:ORX65999.1 hypothetical protein BCR32DRAFT_286387 [Anaeromyces robustus]